MADGLFGGAYVGNPNIQRQGARARALAQQRDVNTLPDPRTYAAVQGLFGTPPDQMGFSVLNPQYQSIMQTAQPAFAAGTALGIAPAAQVLRGPTMAIGRAGERLAERTVPQIMERGGLPAEILQGMSRGTVSPLDVYHGTPYKFEKLDASKIGTGEGAQVYGHGLYFAENPAVAKGYQSTLGHKGVLDLEYEASQRGIPLSREAQIEFMRQSMRDVLPKIAVKNLQNANIEARSLDADKLTNLFKDYKASKQGSLYKIDLPDEQISKMLDWDKPLSQQSEEVQNAFAKLRGVSVDVNKSLMKADPDKFDKTGEELYKGFTSQFGSQASKASAALREAGITGIKYLDEGSRQPGVTAMTQAQLDTRINILKKDIDSGLGNQDRMKQILSALEKERASHPKLTRNFVVFPGEETSMRILERNGQPANLMYTDPFGNTIADTMR